MSNRRRIPPGATADARLAAVILKTILEMSNAARRAGDSNEQMLRLQNLQRAIQRHAPKISICTQAILMDIEQDPGDH